MAKPLPTEKENESGQRKSIIPYSTTLSAVLFAFASVVQANARARTSRGVFLWRKVEFTTRSIKISSTVANLALMGHLLKIFRVHPSIVRIA